MPTKCIMWEKKLFGERQNNTIMLDICCGQLWIQFAQFPSVLHWFHWLMQHSEICAFHSSYLGTLKIFSGIMSDYAEHIVDKHTGCTLGSWCVRLQKSWTGSLLAPASVAESENSFTSMWGLTTGWYGKQTNFEGAHCSLAPSATECKHFGRFLKLWCQTCAHACSTNSSLIFI